jgi:hypothetical protein
MSSHVQGLPVAHLVFIQSSDFSEMKNCDSSSCPPCRGASQHASHASTVPGGRGSRRQPVIWSASKANVSFASGLGPGVLQRQGVGHPHVWWCPPCQSGVEDEHAYTRRRALCSLRPATRPTKKTRTAQPRRPHAPAPACRGRTRHTSWQAGSATRSPSPARRRALVVVAAASNTCGATLRLWRRPPC